MDSKHILGITVLVILALGVGHVSSLTKPSSIKFINNSYTGIVVAIHRDVPENQNLITIIKVMILLVLKFLKKERKGKKPEKGVVNPCFKYNGHSDLKTFIFSTILLDLLKLYFATHF